MEVMVIICLNKSISAPVDRSRQISEQWDRIQIGRNFLKSTRGNMKSPSSVSKDQIPLIPTTRLISPCGRNFPMAVRIHVYTVCCNFPTSNSCSNGWVRWLQSLWLVEVLGSQIPCRSNNHFSAQNLARDR